MDEALLNTLKFSVDFYHATDSNLRGFRVFIRSDPNFNRGHNSNNKFKRTNRSCIFQLHS